MLDERTVFVAQEKTMNKSDYRHLYQPRPDRLPRWMWRVWGWF